MKEQELDSLVDRLIGNQSIELFDELSKTCAFKELFIVLGASIKLAAVCCAVLDLPPDLVESLLVFQMKHLNAEELRKLMDVEMMKSRGPIQ